MVSSTLLLLPDLWKILVFPTLLSAAMIALARFYIQPNQALRKTIVSNRLWKLQFLCHPCIIAGIGIASSLSRTNDNNLIANYATLSAFFAFNFGVEPFDLPNDRIFFIFFYLHHYVVVLANVLILSLHNDDINDNDNNANIKDFKFSYGCAQAILLGHAWLMHPIGYLSGKNLIDKQVWFGPYIASGFLCMVYWADQPPVPAFHVLRIPVALQYIGRWGLYLRICALYGWHQPGSPNYDAFEWRKQYYEFASFGLAFLFASIR